jgi:fructan beta-fructosidase
VTWHNTAPRAVFIGWMSNWTYAKDLPTSPWRSAMTLPRELSLQRVGNEVRLSNRPTQEVLQRLQNSSAAAYALATDSALPSDALRQTDGRFAIELNAASLQDFTLTLSNEAGDALHIGYDTARRSYWIDRAQAGLSDFNPEFAKRHDAPRVSDATEAQIWLYFDRTSVELFADRGLTSMTSLHFPREPWSQWRIQATGAMREGHVLVSGFR